MVVRPFASLTEGLLAFGCCQRMKWALMRWMKSAVENLSYWPVDDVVVDLSNLFLQQEKKWDVKMLEFEHRSVHLFKQVTRIKEKGKCQQKREPSNEVSMIAVRREIQHERILSTALIRRHRPENLTIWERRERQFLSFTARSSPPRFPVDVIESVYVQKDNTHRQDISFSSVF